MSQNITKCHTFSNLWYKATFTFYVWIRLGTTLKERKENNRWCNAGRRTVFGGVGFEKKFKKQGIFKSRRSAFYSKYRNN